MGAPFVVCPDATGAIFTADERTMTVVAVTQRSMTRNTILRHA
jgi:hypothetical protein